MMKHGDIVIGLVLAGLTAGGGGPATAGTALERLGMDILPVSDPRAAIVPRGGLPVPAILVAEETATLPGGDGLPVSVLNAPFTNGVGDAGFTGAFDDAGTNDHFVAFDGAIAWRNSDSAGSVLTGSEGTMGISDAAGFIYSPSVDGGDAVWTQNGLLAVEGTQAPGFADGTTTTFHSRPTMTPDGAAYWIAGFNDTGGTGTEGRVLYRASDATPGTISIVLRSDDLVDGLPIARSSGVGFDYRISDNGAHHIHVLSLDTGGADIEVVYVDGAVVAREAEPTGDGDNWEALDLVSINDAGDYLFSGNTDADTATAEFIAHDGSIAVREGDSIDGVSLASASVQAVSINNAGQAVHIWSTGGVDHLFASCDASDLAASSRRLLSAGDSVDFDGDGVADAVIADFNASSAIGPGLDLAEDGRVFFDVDLDAGGTEETGAIISIAMPACDRIFADGFEMP